MFGVPLVSFIGWLLFPEDNPMGVETILAYGSTPHMRSTTNSLASGPTLSGRHGLPRKNEIPLGAAAAYNLSSALLTRRAVVS
jgi:hypothetical protein